MVSRKNYLFVRYLVNRTPAQISDDDMDEDSEDDAEFCGSDDESCWESVGSDEEDDEYATPIQRTRTEIIYEFFNSKSYKRYEVERDGLPTGGL